ncbi:hypothetical protein [Paenibacillus montanisoli]|uniref:Uncharacterized protein n=1 Tax=Paenibacillus montanisoli TaxID=2081970 RepID=A0A328U3Q2_9BACL|nr:hypothetical protein [Paenibacillus montanisoli]RAP77240.1 hypothetical protein DL346_01690 [Paenibacillus montanisoli]
MKVHFFRAVAVGLIFVIVFYAFQFIQGMYLTMKHVPDLVESYESVNHLQDKVTFGYQSSSIWRTVEIPVLMLLGIVVYYTLRKWRKKK